MLLSQFFQLRRLVFDQSTPVHPFQTPNQGGYPELDEQSLYGGWKSSCLIQDVQHYVQQLIIVALSQPPADHTFGSQASRNVAWQGSRVGQKPNSSFNLCFPHPLCLKIKYGLKFPSVMSVKIIFSYFSALFCNGPLGGQQLLTDYGGRISGCGGNSRLYISQTEEEKK